MQASPAAITRESPENHLTCNVLRIKTFGGLSVERSDATLAGAAAQPRRLAILAILARHGARGFSRDKLVSLLWPDDDEERARKNLAQALYALRRDLGSEEAISGIRELTLDPGIVTSDVAEFEDALAARELDRAVSLHVAPFLDGVHVTGSAEFERWAEIERAELQQKCTTALQRIAQRDAERGDHLSAAAAWRRLAGADPLNARIALSLMRSLAVSGDIAGALNHARVYEILASQELDLPLDREIVKLAQQLRESPESFEVAPVVAPVTTPLVAPRPEAVHATPAAVPPRPRSGTTIALGRLVDRTGDATGLGDALGDLLPMGIARVPGVALLSASRVAELVEEGATPEGAWLSAARRAGASHVIDGTLFALVDGSLRLDLRLVDVDGGTIVGVATTVERDLFTLADRAAGELAAVMSA